MLAWFTHILPGELWKPVYGLCGLRCVRRLRGQVRIPCHSTRSHKRDVSPCVRWSLLRESNVVALLDGFEPSAICLTGNRSYRLSYRSIEAARETRGRKMPVKPWEEAFLGDSFRRLRGKRLTAFGGSAYTNFSTVLLLVGYLQCEVAAQRIRAGFVQFVQHCRNCPKFLPDRCCHT